MIMTNRGVFKFLDTVGDGSGERSLAKDYSTLEGLYYSKPPEGTIYTVTQLIIAIESSGRFRVDGYGDINGGLDNGIKIAVLRDLEVVLDLTNGTPIKTNGDWHRMCFDVDLVDGPGGRLLTAKWNFLASGKPLFLDGTLKEVLVVTVHDDLSDLDSHTVMINGHSRPS